MRRQSMKILASLLGALAVATTAVAADQRNGPGAQVQPATPGSDTAHPARTSYIVQAQSVATALAAVHHAGGTVTHRLAIIDAVAASLSAAQSEELRARGLTLFPDAGVKPTATDMRLPGSTDGGGSVSDTFYPTLVHADALHSLGIDGTGVTIAIVDSGTMPDKAIVTNAAGQTRLMAGYDAIANKSIAKLANTDSDGYGHGTHLAGIAVSSRTDPSTGHFNGVAPGANLVYVKAFDNTGKGTYSDVIRGIDWVVSNKGKYNIRVMNLSFSAAPQSWYWNDPLNQAVMKAWQAGIVVVAAAGNSGPYALSIGVPGNVPYVITVGAMTDSFTRSDPSDDRLASFSSTGPTYEGFVKPEVVAPGGHMLAVMGTNDYLPKTYPQFSDGTYYFQMSGTSQATAVTSGVVALLLQANASLTPDQVKCKLISSARAAVDSTGKLAYSVFQQGTGLVDAYVAMLNPYTSCGNAGLDIAKDLAGTQHYGGPARQDAATGSYYVVDSSGNRINSDGYLWNNGYLWNSGYLWTNGYLWSNGYLWNSGYLWTNGYLWNNGYLWSNSTVTSASSPMNTATMIPQE